MGVLTWEKYREITKRIWAQGLTPEDEDYFILREIERVLDGENTSSQRVTGKEEGNG